MKKIYIILFVLLISACSAEWHLKRALHLNPNLRDSIKVRELVVVKDTIRDTILVESHNFDFVVDSLSNLLGNYALLYNDSFVTIYGRLDSLGKLNLKGKIKEKRIPYEVIIHDTIPVEVKCPPQVTLTEGYPKWRSEEHTSELQSH